MKTVRSKGGKLQLAKETLRSLTRSELGVVAGGSDPQGHQGANAALSGLCVFVQSELVSCVVPVDNTGSASQPATICFPLNLTRAGNPAFGGH